MSAHHQYYLNETKHERVYKAVSASKIITGSVFFWVWILRVYEYYHRKH